MPRAGRLRRLTEVTRAVLHAAVHGMHHAKGVRVFRHQVFHGLCGNAPLVLFLFEAHDAQVRAAAAHPYGREGRVVYL